MSTPKIRFIVELPNAHVIYMTSNLAIFTHVQDVRTMQNARAGRLSNYFCMSKSSKAFVVCLTSSVRQQRGIIKSQGSKENKHATRRIFLFCFVLFFCFVFSVSLHFFSHSWQVFRGYTQCFCSENVLTSLLSCYFSGLSCFSNFFILWVRWKLFSLPGYVASFSRRRNGQMFCVQSKSCLKKEAVVCTYCMPLLQRLL